MFQYGLILQPPSPTTTLRCAPLPPPFATNYLEVSWILCAWARFGCSSSAFRRGEGRPRRANGVPVEGTLVQNGLDARPHQLFWTCKIRLFEKVGKTPFYVPKWIFLIFVFFGKLHRRIVPELVAFSSGQIQKRGMSSSLRKVAMTSTFIWLRRGKVRLIYRVVCYVAFLVAFWNIKFFSIIWIWTNIELSKSV